MGGSSKKVSLAPISASSINSWLSGVVLYGRMRSYMLQRVCLRQSALVLQNPMTTRQISQTYFDESVHTNIELLDQTLDEAIEEAVQTFTIQVHYFSTNAIYPKGVDLSNIVKDMVKFQDGHPCVMALQNFKTLISADPHDYAALVECLKLLKNFCELDASHRGYLQSMNLQDLLKPTLDSCISNEKDECILRVLQLTGALCIEKPLLFQTENGKEYFNQLLQLQSDRLTEDVTTDLRLEIIASLYLLLRAACTGCEPNRTIVASDPFILARTIELLAKLDLASCGNDSSALSGIVRASCGFLRSLTMDDDMTVEFGQGSENARTIASMSSALEIFIKLTTAATSSTNERCLIEIFNTVSTILTREEFCLKFMELGGIDLVFGNLYEYVDSATISSACLALLRTLCGSDDCKRVVGLWTLKGDARDATPVSGSRIIVNVMERHLHSSPLCRNAAGVIGAMTLRQPDLAEHVIEAGAAECLAKALHLHLSDASTVRAICMAIRNCVARSPHLCVAFVGDVPTSIDGTVQPSSDPFGLESQLNAALRVRACADEAKAALRDLGCRVKLKELWFGKSMSDVKHNIHEVEEPLVG